MSWEITTFRHWIKDQRTLFWVIFTTFLATCGKASFTSTNLTTLLLDEKTGNIYVGAAYFVYKLDNNLTVLAKRNTTEIFKDDLCSDRYRYINRILLITDDFDTPGLLGCGSGSCAFLNITTLEPYKKSESCSVVAIDMRYPAVALVDKVNKKILFGNTQEKHSGNLILTRDIASYKLENTLKLVASIVLSKERQKTKYLAGMVVDEYRYFFTVSPDGSSIVRLCEAFNPVADEIFTYTELPFYCVGHDGTKFEQLLVIKSFLPGSELAKSFGIFLNDSVVVGMFNNSKNERAVCVYSFKEINDYFWINIKKCASNISIYRNEYLKVRCVIEPSPSNCSAEGSNNDKLVGTIPYERKAIVTCSTCQLSASMDVGIYRNKTIAFIGTGYGGLAKVLISSRSSGEIYEILPRIPGSEIISVNLKPNMPYLYMMTTNKVIKVPVEECSNHKSCEECVKGGDPYCAWCTVYAKCVTYEQCPDYSSLLGYNQNINQCINITSIYPEELPLSETGHLKVNISIDNLPPRNPRDAYDCFINGRNMTRKLIENNILECLVPISSQLPKANTGTGKVAVEVAVYSSETKIKIISATMNFYNCTAISNCLNCTTGLLTCSWCNYEALCFSVDEASSLCPDSYVPWVRDVSAHTCPLLKNQTIYIPSNVEREITINAMQLPKPKSKPQNPTTGDYKCIVTVAGVPFDVPAKWNNATSLTCGHQKYKYSGDTPDKKVLPAKIRIELGKSVIEPEVEDITVYLFKCNLVGESCGSCLGLWNEEYHCGWCPPKRLCLVKDGCRSPTWIKHGGICPTNPNITWFYPPTGPVAGNTKLEFNGTELGRAFEDITNVSIGEVPCHVIESEYVVAKRIVCQTNASSKGTFSAKIKVVVSGKTGLSNKRFRYQKPDVDDFKPKMGPASGGTLIKITGRDLDTGRNIIVTIGQSPCAIQKTENKLIECKTSPSVTRRRRSADKSFSITFDGSPPKSSPKEVFQYVPDANITNITPLYTFPSCDVAFTVTGTNLDAIQNPKLVLQFKNQTKRLEKDCEKPSNTQMICPVPNVSPLSNDDKVAKISLLLDSVTKWEDLSGYPFRSIEFVPDPVITPFVDEVSNLNTAVLEISGRNLVAPKDRNLIKFVITVGGQLCNITSKDKDIIYCKLPSKASLPKLESYEVVVNVSSSNLSFNVGMVTFPITVPRSPKDLTNIYMIIGVVAALVLIILIVICCLYRRKRKQQQQSERTFEMQMNSLESKVAKECREAFAELQTDMTDFTSDLGGVGIHYFDFKNYAMRVLFPGVDHHVVMEEKRAPESPKWEEALRTFSQLIGNKNFLLIFVKTLENQQQFKMQDRCNVASLLVIALQNKMEYCTEILQQLLAELIRKSMSKSHPKLLLRRTECVAEKLLTNWLTFTLTAFIKDKASKPLFMVYKAIKFQVEKGPIDAITNEARYSLSEDKLLRQSIEYNVLTVTVEFEDNPPVQVEVLDTDTIDQTKNKIMDVLFKNIPFSSRLSKDELDLKWVESPSNHRILKDEDKTSVVEGDWKKINTLAHYEVPDRTCLRLVRRFASPFDTSDIMQSSFSKESYSPTLASNSSFLRRSRNNLTEELKPWHLTKHSDYVQEKDDPRHSKLLSEIYLTRLLSTKGTLQQYVDDLFDSIFLALRKNERPPLPIKFLFDFLDKQATELNITDPEVLHTWKNNSLPLRFWVNLIKNPNFLFDVHKAPIIDSCLTVIAQLFMDACSVSEHRLGKDSPSNKLLYAKEIPAYKQKVERFYQDVSDAPSFTEEEVKNFFASHHNEDFNVDNALKELYKYAAKYQDELQEAFEDSHYPQLASKLEHVVAIFSDD